METTLALVINALKKLVIKYAKGKVIKHFLKDICFVIVAILIMLSSSLGRFQDGVLSVKVYERGSFARVLNFESNRGRIESDVVGVDRIEFGCPVNREVRLNAGFGYWPGYWNGTSDWHNGLDLDIVEEKVYSSISGVVVSTSWDYMGGGNLLVIQGLDGWRTWYAHMAKIEAVVGERIVKGDYVGVSGNTGSKSTGYHLHVTILHYGDFVNPLKYMSQCTTYGK